MDSKNLRTLLSYDPETGIFTWNERPSVRFPFNKVGARAGFLGASGYRYIKYLGKLHREHRLAYEFVHGSIPDGVEIDHKNGIGTDNRIENLRLATHQQNIANKKNGKNNTSGRKGVHLHTDGRWRAVIMVFGKRHHLGLFSSVDEAGTAYISAAKKYFGEFARAE